jgi:hypothetical protein
MATAVFAETSGKLTFDSVHPWKPNLRIELQMWKPKDKKDSLFM